MSRHSPSSNHSRTSTQSRDSSTSFRRHRSTIRPSFSEAMAAASAAVPGGSGLRSPHHGPPSPMAVPSTPLAPSGFKLPAIYSQKQQERSSLQQQFHFPTLAETAASFNKHPTVNVDSSIHASYGGYTSMGSQGGPHGGLSKETRQRLQQMTQPTHQVAQFPDIDLDTSPFGDPSSLNTGHYTNYGTLDSSALYSTDGINVSPIQGMMQKDHEQPILWAVRHIIMTFVPASLTSALFYLSQAITTMFVGKYLGAVMLSHYALGLSVFNITALSICIGFAGALDTLASQSHGRLPMGPELWILFQRGLMLCLLCAAPLIVFFYLSEPILLLFFEPAMAKGTSEFLRCSPGYLVAQIVNYCLMKTLQAQKLASLPMISAIMSTLCCPLLLFVVHRSIPGVVLAISLTQLIQILIQFFLIVAHPTLTWRIVQWPISQDAFNWKGIKGFISLAFPSVLSLCSEWWTFEMLIFLASRFGTIAIDSLAIILNIVLLFYSLPQGMGIAVGMLIGNALGEGDPDSAKRYLYAGFFLLVILIMVDATVIDYFGMDLFRLYTNHPLVAARLNQLKPLLIALHVADACQAVLQGVFRCAGKSSTSAFISVLSLWGVGIPLVIVLSFYQRDQGILEGLVLVFFTLLIPSLLLHMICYWDWVDMADKALTAHGWDVQENEPFLTPDERSIAI